MALLLSCEIADAVFLLQSQPAVIFRGVSAVEASKERGQFASQIQVLVVDRLE